MTNVTRRDAIRSTALAALMASLAGATGATEAAPALPALAHVVNADDLAQACRDLYEEQRAALLRHNALADELAATLTPEQRTLMIRAADASTTTWCLEEDWRIAEIARHLPGLAPSILMLHRHLDGAAFRTPGACCTPSAGFES